MLLPAVAVGPVVALGASLVYCAKGREETKKPGGGSSSSIKKPSLAPKSVKSHVKSNRSSKNGSNGPRSTSRSSKGLSSKPRNTQNKLSKGGSDKKSSKGKESGKSDKSKSKSKSKKKDKKEKDPKKKKSEEDKESQKETKSEKEKKKKKEDHNEQKIDAPFQFCDLKEKFSASASLVAAAQTVEMKMIPSKLNWKKSGGFRQVHIVNNSDERRAIKAKCTDNLIYRVHPVYGFIAPGESFKVDVLRNNAAGKSDLLVFLTAKAQDKKDPRECFADKTRPTEMLVMPLLPEKVES